MNCTCTYSSSSRWGCFVAWPCPVVFDGIRTLVLWAELTSPRLMLENRHAPVHLPYHFLQFLLETHAVRPEVACNRHSKGNPTARRQKSADDTYTCTASLTKTTVLYTPHPPVVAMPLPVTAPPQPPQSQQDRSPFSFCCSFFCLFFSRLSFFSAISAAATAAATAAAAAAAPSRSSEEELREGRPPEFQDDDFWMGWS